MRLFTGTWALQLQGWKCLREQWGSVASPLTRAGVAAPPRKVGFIAYMGECYQCGDVEQCEDETATSLRRIIIEGILGLEGGWCGARSKALGKEPVRH